MFTFIFINQTTGNKIIIMAENSSKAKELISARYGENHKLFDTIGPNDSTVIE